MKEIFFALAIIHVCKYHFAFPLPVMTPSHKTGVKTFLKHGRMTHFNIAEP